MIKTLSATDFDRLALGSQSKGMAGARLYLVEMKTMQDAATRCQCSVPSVYSAVCRIDKRLYIEQEQKLLGRHFVPQKNRYPLILLIGLSPTGKVKVPTPPVP